MRKVLLALVLFSLFAGALAAQPVITTPATLPWAELGIDYEDPGGGPFTLAATGGTLPYTWL